MPPTRNVRSAGALCAAMSDGEKKNTRFCWNAERINAVAMPSTARLTAISTSRLWRGFMPLALHHAAARTPRDILRRTPTPGPQENDFCRDQRDRDEIGAPNVERITAHFEKPGNTTPVHSRSRP